MGEKNLLKELHWMMIVITTDYYYCLLMAVVLALFVAISCAPIGGLRKKYFSAEFLEENFGKEHREAFGPDSKPPKNGYPDCGDGRYSEKLTYEQWFNFNNAQRAHQNGVEQLPLYLVNLFLGGLFNPRAAALVGLLTLLCRVQYTVGYLKGPGSRLPGAILGTVANMLFLGYTLYETGSLIYKNSLWQ